MHVATLSVLRTASRYGFNADTGGPDEEEEDEKEDMMVVRVLFYGVGKWDREKVLNVLEDNYFLIRSKSGNENNFLNITSFDFIFYSGDVYK